MFEYFFGIGTFFGLFATALVINGFYQSFGPCVKLPNGIIVSHEAYINFSNPYFVPNVVVKGPDGTVFSRGNDGTFYFSETTAWWIDIHAGKYQNFYAFWSVAHLRQSGYEGLAYRPDVGLVSA